MAEETFHNRLLQKNISFPKGSILFKPNSEYVKLNFLNKGSVSLFFDNISNQDKFVMNVPPKSLILTYLLLTTKINRFKIIASDDVIIDSYPFQTNPLLFLKQNSAMTKLFLKSLLYDFNTIIKQVRKFHDLSVMIQKTYDNSLLFQAFIPNKNAMFAMDNSQMKLLKDMEELKSLFTKNSGFFPQDFSLKFLDIDNSQYLGKSYKFSADYLNCDSEGLSLMLSYTKLPSSVTDFMLKNNPDFIYYLFKSFSNDINLIFDFLENSIKNMDEQLNSMFSIQNNIFVGIYRYLETTGNNAKLNEYKTYVQNLYSTISKNYKNYFNIISLPFTLNQNMNSICLPAEPATPASKAPETGETAKQGNILDDINELTKDISTKNSSTDIDIDSIIEKQVEKNKINVSNTLKYILEFTRYEQDRAGLLGKALNKLLSFNDKFSDNPDLRKIRKIVQQALWELYFHVFVKILKEKTAPNNAIRMFIKYCMLDERFITNEHYNNLLNYDDNSVSEYPMYYSDSWLMHVFNGNKLPSINDLGQSLDEIIKEEEKRISKEKDTTPLELRRLKFEVDNLFERGYRILTDSPLTAIPLFMSEKLPKDLATVLLTKQKLENEINEIVKIDYSIFYKESLFRQENKVEIYFQEIKPEFIFLPTFGSKIAMWQDFSGNKYGPARFLVPLFFMGDLHKALLKAFGHYRWEICKTFKGPGWADPVDGGITGKYLDYINFYHKNQRISPEVKEKIKENFSRYRTDREKFASDYGDWVDYESKGILKMNTLVREIFVFEIPLPKATMLNLKRIPAFDKLITRFINKRKQFISKEQNKLRKFADEEDQLPPDIQKYIDFLKT